MLYLLVEHFDNGLEYEDHKSYDTDLGVYDNMELAKKELEEVLLEAEKYGRKVGDKFEKTDDGYTLTFYYGGFESEPTVVTHSYFIRSIELNTRID